MARSFFLKWRVCSLVILFTGGLGGLWGCAATGENSSKANSPLPNVNPIQVASSIALRRKAAAPADANPAESSPEVRIFLYVSLASQEQLMLADLDPTSSTRIWENYFREARIPFSRVSSPAEVNRLPASGLLILASTVMLSEPEKLAVKNWRDRGGAVLSTWKTAIHSSVDKAPDFSFMREVLDVEVVGDTAKEKDDTFMMVHGDDPVTNTMAAGTRVWMERLPGQLPLRFIGKREAAQVKTWSHGVDAKKSAGLISYNERKMPSGQYSRVVSLGYPEQIWTRSDPNQLKIITEDIFAWLLRSPKAYLGAWPYPFQSATLIALQAAEQVSDVDLNLAKTIASVGGRLTLYVQGASAQKAAPLIKSVADLGHEIAYFGDAFEGFKGQSKTQQSERFLSMQKQLEAAGLSVRAPASFAAPSESYDRSTVQLLDEYKFANYLATMDVTNSQLPFLNDKSGTGGAVPIALPRTLIGPEEALDDDAEAGLENFLSAYKRSLSTGGLAVVRLPTQSLLVPEQYARLLDGFKQSQPRTWIASASQISSWWREREQISISFAGHPQGYLLKAQVARATLGPEQFSVWVNLPNPNSRVRIKAVNSGNPLPRIIPVDGLRAVLSVQNLPAGEHSWIVQFE